MAEWYVIVKRAGDSMHNMLVKLGHTHVHTTHTQAKESSGVSDKVCFKG